MAWCVAGWACLFACKQALPCTLQLAWLDSNREHLCLHTWLQALFDLEATNTELKGDLRDLYITSAREIDIHNTTRKAIIVHVRAAVQLLRVHA